jgi:hypothetical protein
MSACSFSVCSLITDVRDSVNEMPRQPDEVKSLLLEHLGFGNKPEPKHIDVTAVECAFKHPISYTNPDKLHELPTSIIEDLELLQVKPKLNTPKHYWKCSTTSYWNAVSRKIRSI